MKTIINRHPPFIKRIIMAVIFITIVVSCSKNTTNTTSALKFCGSVDWTSTLGFSGYFKGALEKGTYGLTSVNLTDNGTPKTVTFTRDGSGHIMNQSGMTFTYDQDNLVKIVWGTSTGFITFTFDTSSHLTQSPLQNQDSNGSDELTLNYTYDTNGDPVNISGLGVLISGSETSTANYDITADYLTSKDNFLPLLPELAPFTPEFAYSWFLSTHLINKWLIKITTTAGGKTNTSNITQQYTYTYDTDGKVATMWHSSNNIYSFTYSGCN